jgi:hypothetical protein
VEGQSHSENISIRTAGGLQSDGCNESNDGKVAVYAPDYCIERAGGTCGCFPKASVRLEKCEIFRVSNIIPELTLELRVQNYWPFFGRRVGDNDGGLGT